MWQGAHQLIWSLRQPARSASVQTEKTCSHNCLALPLGVRLGDCGAGIGALLGSVWWPRGGFRVWRCHGFARLKGGFYLLEWLLVVVVILIWFEFYFVCERCWMSSRLQTLPNWVELVMWKLSWPCRGVRVVVVVGQALSYPCWLNWILELLEMCLNVPAYDRKQEFYVVSMCMCLYVYIYIYMYMWSEFGLMDVARWRFWCWMSSTCEAR